MIDCLEFDSDLRWVDPAEEIAFLALECRKLGAGAVARALVAHYRASTLTPPDAALMDFYTSQSAMTRAKLAAWHVRDPRDCERLTSLRSEGCDGRGIGALASRPS